MTESTRWVSVTDGADGVLAAVDACRREAGALALDLDDVEISVRSDGGAGYQVHAVYLPGMEG